VWRTAPLDRFNILPIRSHPLFFFSSVRADPLELALNPIAASWPRSARPREDHERHRIAFFCRRWRAQFHLLWPRARTGDDAVSSCAEGITDLTCVASRWCGGRARIASGRPFFGVEPVEEM